VRVSLSVLNAADRQAWLGVLGGLFENSPWVAEQAWHGRPYGSVAALHQAMCEIVAGAPEDRKVELLRAHPELAGRLARTGAMTASSKREQASVGLGALSDQEFARFDALNAAYRKKFGFPFIVAVREHTKESILDTFARRLESDRATEIAAALGEIFKITRMRLDQMEIAE